MYEQVLQARRLMALSPLEEMIAMECSPGSGAHSEEDVKKWITDSFTTVFRMSPRTFHLRLRSLMSRYHRTCSMPPRNKGGVVSPELKVYGTTNVRVADVSVVPLHVGASTICECFVCIWCLSFYLVASVTPSSHRDLSLRLPHTLYSAVKAVRYVDPSCRSTAIYALLFLVI
jgi:hypothetical protein